MLSTRLGRADMAEDVASGMEREQDFLDLVDRQATLQPLIQGCFQLSDLAAGSEGGNGDDRLLFPARCIRNGIFGGVAVTLSSVLSWPETGTSNQRFPGY